MDIVFWSAGFAVIGYCMYRSFKCIDIYYDLYIDYLIEFSHRGLDGYYRKGDNWANHQKWYNSLPSFNQVKPRFWQSKQAIYDRMIVGEYRDEFIEWYLKKAG